MKKFFIVSTILLVGIAVICLGSLATILFFGSNRIDNLGNVGEVNESKAKEERALVILVESNSFIDSLSYNLYDQYAGVSNVLLGYLFEVNPKDLKGMALDEIVEDYGEPWLVDNLEKEAGSYHKVVSLLDEEASFDSFVQNVNSLSE